MGLDLSFHVKGDDTPILEMDRHYEFLTMFTSQPTARVYRGYDDFWVDDDILDGVEMRLDQRRIRAGLSEHACLTEPFDRLRLSCPENLPQDTLILLYRQAVVMLRTAIRDHDRLVCSWSA